MLKLLGGKKKNRRRSHSGAVSDYYGEDDDEDLVSQESAPPLKTNSVDKLPAANRDFSPTTQESGDGSPFTPATSPSGAYAVETPGSVSVSTVIRNTAANSASKRQGEPGGSAWIKSVPHESTKNPSKTRFAERNESPAPMLSLAIPDDYQLQGSVDGEEDDDDDDDDNLSCAADPSVVGIDQPKKKKKKRSVFGIKVPKAIKHMGNTSSGSKSSKNVKAPDDMVAPGTTAAVSGTTAAKTTVSGVASVSGGVQAISIGAAGSTALSLSAEESKSIEVLRSRLERLQASYDEAQNFLDAKTFTLAQMEKARDDDQAEFALRLRQLEEALELERKKVETLEAERIGLKKAIETAGSATGVLDHATEIALAELQAQNASLEAQNRRLTAQLAALQAQIVELERACAEKDRLLTSKDNELQDMRTQLQEALTKVDQATYALKAEKERDDVLDQARLLEEEKGRLLEKIQSLERELEQTSHDDFTRASVEAAVEQENLQAQIRALKDQKQASERAAEEKNRALELDLAEKDHKIEELLREVELQHEEKRALKDLAQRREGAAVRDLQSQAADLSQELQNSKFTIANLERQVKDYTTLISELKERTQLLEIELSTTANTAAKNRREADAATKRLETVNVEKEQGEIEITTLQAEIAGWAERLESLEVALRQRDDEIARITAEKDKAVSSNEIRTRELEAVKKALTAESAVSPYGPLGPDEEANRLKKVITQLESSNAGLTANAEAAQAALREAQAEVARLKTEQQAPSATAAEQGRSKLTSELAAAKRELQQRASVLEAKQSELASVTAHANALESEVADLKTRVRAAEQRIHSDDAVDLIRLRNEVVTAKQRSEEQDGLIAQLKERIHSLEKDLREAESNLEREREDIARRGADSSRRATELENKLRQLSQDATARLNALHADLTATREELDKARADLVQEKTVSDLLRSEKQQLKTRLDDRTEELRSVSSAATMRSGTLQKQLETARQELQNAFDTASEETARLRRELKDAHAARIAAEESTRQLQSDISVVKREMVLATANHDTLQASLDIAQKQVALLKDQLRAVASEREGVQTSYGALESELRQQLNANVAEKAALELERDSFKAQLDVLSSQIRDRSAEIETIRTAHSTDVASLRRQIAKLEAEKDDVEANANETKRKLNSTVERAEALEHELEDIKRQSKVRLGEKDRELELLQDKILRLQNSSKTLVDESSNASTELAKRIDALREKLRGAEQKNEELEGAVQSLEREKGSLLNKVYELEAADERWREEVGHLQNMNITGLKTRALPSEPIPTAKMGQGTFSSLPGEPAHAVSGTLLSNALVACNSIPSKIQLMTPSKSFGHDSVDSTSTIGYGGSARRAAVVAVLKARLVDALFDTNLPGAPLLPASLFGKNVPASKGGAGNRSIMARVLCRIQKLWALAEDMRLGLVQLDPGLSERFQESKTNISDWQNALSFLRGSAEVLEQRNEKLETLVNQYHFAAKEARAAAQLEREKCQASIANYKKRLANFARSRDSLEIELRRLRQGLSMSIEENRRLALPPIGGTYTSQNTQNQDTLRSFSAARAASPNKMLQQGQDVGFSYLNTPGPSYLPAHHANLQEAPAYQYSDLPTTPLTEARLSERGQQYSPLPLSAASLSTAAFGATGSSNRFSVAGHTDGDLKGFGSSKTFNPVHSFSRRSLPPSATATMYSVSPGKPPFASPSGISPQFPAMPLSVSSLRV